MRESETKFEEVYLHESGHFGTPDVARACILVVLRDKRTLLERGHDWQ